MLKLIWEVAAILGMNLVCATGAMWLLTRGHLTGMFMGLMALLLLFVADLFILVAATANKE